MIAIREELFIEGARAIGLSSLAILSRHVLPNLLSTMLALAALEMGSALLLLGELGFVSVFIGGGGAVAGIVGSPTVIFAEIPDWGGMLGTSWRYFRALPWLPAMPAMAFFISIFSFNLLGYGMQRFIEKGRFYPSGWSVMRFVAISAILLFGAQFILLQSGPETQFKEKAKAFSIERAWRDITFLTSPEMGGRVPGTEGAGLAASYIAAQFKSLDLTPFSTGSYFQTYPAQHGQILQDPVLEILDANGDVVGTIEEGIEYDRFNVFSNEGSFQGKIMIAGRRSSFVNFQRGLFLVIETNFGRVAIRIMPDDSVPDVDQPPLFYGPLSFLSEFPALVLRESAASELLSPIGYDIEELITWASSDERAVSEFFTSLSVRVRFGLRYDIIPAINVAGYIPGSDVRVQTQRILVAAPSTGNSPYQGKVYPGADENASGVAVLLEVMRLWQEQEFVPKRTVVFAAFDEVGGLYIM